MTVEDELRECLARMAATMRTSPDAWQKIIERTDKRQRAATRPLVRVAVSVVVLLVLGGLAAALQRGSTSGDVTLTSDGVAARVRNPPPGPPEGSVLGVGFGLGAAHTLVRFDLPGSQVDSLLETVSDDYHHAAVVADTIYVVPGCVGSHSSNGLLRAQGNILALVPGTPQLQACGVAPGPGGTVAWVTDGTPVPAPSGSRPRSADWSVHLWDPATGLDRVVLKSRGILAGPATGPDGSLAVLESTGRPVEDGKGRVDVTLVRPDGSVTRNRLKGSLKLGETASTSAPDLSWGASNLLAIAVSEDPTVSSPPFKRFVVVADPFSGAVVRKIADWAGTAWSPDGSSLFIARQTERMEEAKGSEIRFGERFRTELAVATGPKFEVRRLGETIVPGAVVPSVWLPEGTTTTSGAIERLASGFTEGQRWSVSALTGADGAACFRFFWEGGGVRSSCATKHEIPTWPPTPRPVGLPVAPAAAYPLHALACQTGRPCYKGTAAVVQLVTAPTVVSVQLEFADGTTERVATRASVTLGAEHSLAFVGVTQPVMALVAFSADGEITDRISCDLSDLSHGLLGTTGPCATPGSPR